MKQQIRYHSQEVPQNVAEFISIWKRRKKYSPEPSLTLGECIELLIATTYNFHKEESDGRFFNNALTNNESSILWDGEELIDILFYELIETIKHRLARNGTFTQEVVLPLDTP